MTNTFALIVKSYLIGQLQEKVIANINQIKINAVIVLFFLHALVQKIKQK